MKYLNILPILALLLSNSALAKFVDVPIRTHSPDTEEETTSFSSTELSDYALQAGLEDDDDLRLLARLYQNAARRSDEQAFKLRLIILKSKLDNFSKINLRVALLLGKMDRLNGEFTESELHEIEKILRNGRFISQDNVKSLLRSLRFASKYTSKNLIDNIKIIRNKLKTYLDKN